VSSVISTQLSWMPSDLSNLRTLLGCADIRGRASR
jgi:hypothetical protein